MTNLWPPWTGGLDTVWVALAFFAGMLVSETVSPAAVIACLPPHSPSPPRRALSPFQFPPLIELPFFFLILARRGAFAIWRECDNTISVLVRPSDRIESESTFVGSIGKLNIIERKINQSSPSDGDNWILFCFYAEWKRVPRIGAFVKLPSAEIRPHVDNLR